MCGHSQNREKKETNVIGAMFYLKIVVSLLLLQHSSCQQFIPRQSPCPAVEFFNRTNDRWHGNLYLKSSGDVKGVQVDVEFDDPVVVFVNNFAHSTSADSRVFSIKDDAQSLKRGQVLKIEFFAKLPGPFRIPLITGLKLNNERICPEVAPTNEDTKCVKFEKTGNETGGRWDGTLTFYPQFPRNGIRVDVQLDRPAWALGNDLGDTRTSDQKRFIITTRRNVRSGSRLSVNLFVKFDELEEIPRITSIWIDGVPACVSGLISRPPADPPSNKFSTTAPRSSGIMLSDLPFQNFPSVTLLPQQVNNNDFDCGLSGSPVQNRFSSGSQANVGQFPFHVAIFRDLIYRCGGSLVSQKTVVTAGHCVVRDNQQAYPSDDFRLLFGVVDLKSLSGAEAVREVAEVIKHPDYEYEKILKQDIAMMIIKGNLQFSLSIRPICLFDFQTPIQNHVNQKATVLGFGSTENSKDPSRYLNFGQMTVISRQSCIESKLIFGLLPEQSAFCAKAVENMIACPGDSGGGLIFNVNGKYFLRGVSSVTITEASGKCDPAQSVAFTDASYFTNWIRQNIRDEPDVGRGFFN